MINSYDGDVSLGVGKRLGQSSKFRRYIRQLKKILVSTVCAGVLGSFKAPAVYAQDATWVGTGLAQWGLGLSWSGGQVPTGTATFSTLGLSTVAFAAGYDATIQNIVFTSGASAYIFQIGGLLTPASLTITGQGITNSSIVSQTFNVGGLLGSGSLSFTGDGTTAGNVLINVGANGNLYFSGSSTAGTSTIFIDNDGLLQFSGTATGGSASVDLDSGGVFNMSGLTSGGMTLGSLTGGGTVNLGANTLSLGATNASMNFSGTISGTGGLAKTGTGLLTLSGNNSFSGGFSILGGNVLGQTINSLGTGAISLSGGGALLGAAGNWGNIFNIAGGATGSVGALTGLHVSLLGGLDVGAGATLNFGQSGYAGTIAFNGSNSSFGAGAAVNVNFGGIRLGDAAAGNFFNVANTTLQLAAGASLDLNGHSATINNLLGAGGISSSVAGNITLGLLGGNFSGNISNGAGVLSLVKTGTGTLTLSGNNSFSGGFNLQGGSLIAGSNTALGTGALTLGSGTSFALGSGISLANAIALNGVASLDVEGAGSGILSGIISGGFGLTKTGAGILTLSGNNTFSGGLHLNAGTLVAGASGALGTGSVSLGNGTELQLGVSGNYNNLVSLAANGNATLSALTGINANLSGGLSLGGGSALSLGSLGNTGTLTVHGGTIGAGASLALNYGALDVGDAAFGAALSAAALAVNADGTFNLNGFNANVGSLSGSGNIGLGGNILTVGALGTNTDFGGIISGAGGLVKTGTGILTLSGNNSFSGGFNLQGGSLIAGSNTALGTGALTLGSGTSFALGSGISLANAIALNGVASLDVEGAGSGILSGIISGGFGLTKTGAGILTLSGNNTFSGGLHLNAGTLVAGASGALGTGSVSLGNGTELQLGVSGNYNNLVSLAANGNATLSALTGINANLSGGLSLGGGSALSLGSLGNTGTLTVHGGTIGAGASLALNYGALDVGDAAFGAALSAAALAVNADGTFNLNGFNANVGSLSGSGNIGLGGNILTVGALGTNTDFGGIISGAGGLVKTGTGILTLSGNNLYTGLTQIADGILNVDGSISSSVTVDAGATLGGNGSVGDVTLSGSLTPGRIGVAGTLQTDSLTMTAGSSLNMDLGNPNTIGGPDNDLLVVNGNLTLNGTLSVNSLVPDLLPGVYRIINYTGSLTNNGLSIGQLPVGINLDDVWIQTIIDAQINFVATAGSDIQFWNGPKMVADGTITGGSGTWQIGSTNWTNYNGQETSEWLGGFAVFQGGGGTATVEGNIAFSGLQFADNGFIIASGAGAVFNARNNAIFRVDSGISGEISAGITGTGLIQKVGGGTLVLSGANILPGGLQINGGTVVVANTNALGTGDVTFNNASGLTFDVNGTWTNNLQVNSGALTTLAAQAGGAVTLTHLNTAANTAVAFGDITNTGKITVMGSGNTINAATNLLVNGGTLVAGDAAFSDAVTQGSLNVAELAEFDLNGFDFTVASLNGSGTVINNGANAVINLQSGSFSGNLENGTGTLGLNKNGSGVLTLSGINLYTGATDVDAGVLNLTGILQNSAVTVNSGATISGNGTMASLNAMSGSIVSPSLNVGTASTLHVTGNLAFAGGATYALNALTNGTSDQLRIDGNATLNGGNVMVRGLMMAGMQYNILTANAGLSGTFQGLQTSNVSDFLTPELLYTNTDVTLKVVRNDTPLPKTGGGSGVGSSGGGNPGVGDAVNTLPGDNPIVMALLNTTVGTAAIGLEQLSGGIFATSKSMVMNDARFGQRLITARLNTSLGMSSDNGMAVAPLGNTTIPVNNIRVPLDTIVTEAISSTAAFSPYPEGINLNVYDGGAIWMQTYGSWGTVDATSKKDGFKRNVGGFFAGIDAPLGSWLVGIAGGYSRSSFHSRRVISSGDADTWRVSLYGGTKYKLINVRLGVQQAWADLETSRMIDFASYRDYLTADYNTRSTQVFADVGVPLAHRDITFEPFAGIAYNYAHSGAFTEEGGPAALRGFASNDHLTTSTLGMRAQTEVTYLDNRTMILRSMVGWRHNFDNASPTSRLAFIASETFSVSGLPFYKDALALSAGVDFILNDKMTVGLNYGGEVASGLSDHGLRVNFRAKY